MALRVSTRMCVWVVLCLWLFLSTLLFGTVALLLYIYEGVLNSFFGPPLTKLAQTTSLTLTGWTLVTFGAAIRTAKANRRSMAMVFLLFATLGFAGELLVLISSARNRESVFGLTLLRDATLRLVNAYANSSMARMTLDVIHLRFECCGIDEWHREWKQVIPFPERLNPLDKEPWVPNSCCTEVYRINSRCGFARIRQSITAVEIIMGSSAFVPMPWFTQIKNEPCPEKIFQWLAEVPIYVLMYGLALCFARMLLTLHAVFAYTEKRKKARRK